MDKIAEEATGIKQNGKLGVMFDKRGIKMPIEEAREVFTMKGETVEIPNAGAGSYREVFDLLGYDKVEVYEWGSSAGDWTFGIHNKEGWFLACQENRYPYHGFKYGLALVQWIGGIDTFKNLCEIAKDFE